MSGKRELPAIAGVRPVRSSRFFRTEAVDLVFSNGSKATYERIPGGPGAVMVIPYDAASDSFVFAREYCVGSENYELGFVKGKIDPGESPADAAGRELGEEIALGARRLTPLRTLYFAPGFMSLKIHLILAEDLYERRLPGGDEPEPVAREPVKRSALRDLIYNPDSELREARCIAALILALDRLGLAI